MDTLIAFTFRDVAHLFLVTIPACLFWGMIIAAAVGAFTKRKGKIK